MSDLKAVKISSWTKGEIMSTSGKFWNDVRSIAKATNPNPVMVGEVISLEPFIVNYQGVDIGTTYGDTIFVNNLLLDENINLDVSSMDNVQSFSNSTAYQSPSFTAEVSGTQKQFLTDFYNWMQVFHDRFILHQGDFVSVQGLGANTYIILGKIQEVINEQ